ncbi:MAG: HAMP domain-containing protein [Magnetococcales bacterium]|nr:HAMP domain-containing protein [Magnetococcales bacterium]
MRLFLKLFLSFWLTLLLTGSVVAWAAYRLRGEAEEMMRQEVTSLLQQRRELGSILERLGIDSLKNLLVVHPDRDVLLVVAADRRELLDRPLPPHLHPLLTRSHRGPPPPPPPGLSPDLFAQLVTPLTVRDPRGEQFRLVIDLHGPPVWRLLRRQPVLPLAAILVSGLVVLLLARHFTQPIRRLRQAHLQLAAGDLGVRVQALRHRIPDELTDLTQAFNYTAEQLERLFQGQVRLLRDLSHELRSPLARMRVALSLMERQRPADDHQQRLTRELERLDVLIGQIITVSRPGRPGGMRQDSWVDLGALAATVVADAAFEAERSGRRLVLEAAGEPPLLLRADPPLLHAAVENLVRNALRYAPPGGEPVIVRLGRLEWQAELTVADRGPGVPEEQLQNIFEPFFRLEESRDRSSGGFGLGLAIAQRAIRDHGGTITASNRAGGGLEVTLRLPLDDPPPDLDLESA